MWSKINELSRQSLSQMQIALTLLQHKKGDDAKNNGWTDDRNGKITIRESSLQTKYTHIFSRQLAANRVFQKHPTIVEMAEKIAFSEGWVTDF